MIQFHNNVENFMAEFSQQHSKLEKLIEQNQFEQASQILLKLMDPVLPSFAFRLVRLPEKPQYMLELTTTLDPLRRILAFYFCSQLPEPLKKTWRFEYSHPALNGSFTHEGVTWNSAEIQVLPFFDNKRHRLNLKVEKNPKFKGLREEDCFMILYIMLSDAIGETAVEAYLGSLQFLDGIERWKTRGKVRVSLDQLAALLHQECHNRGWIDPDDIVFIAKNYTYRTRKLTLRQDITEGVSFCLPLLNEEGRSASHKPSAALVNAVQAAYCSVVVSYPPALSKAEKTVQREKAEKEVNRILSQRKSGILINAALGNAHGYVDFLVFDESTLEAIRTWVKTDPHLEVLELQ
ncbi:hypothetical protein [Holdemania massiliensis]|uniref:hypothetical protein n=1 Tax=Holdemania massiliensis TaxID=1468449 RepID=UPI001F058EEB|nr:hypothetical protein [Holdemania massiliensis]MCH1942772.1 hypothetical protein [Holdemania massiliensis]